MIVTVFLHLPGLAKYFEMLMLCRANNSATFIASDPGTKL
jgi:hypothetical protein